MRIGVVGDESIGPQARTYAEYRLFAALTRSRRTQAFRHAQVILRRTPQRRACGGVACSVTIAFDGGDVLRIHATGDHAYAAINSAVDRIRAFGAAVPAVF